MEKNGPWDEELQRFRAETEELLGIPAVAPKPQKRAGGVNPRFINIDESSV